jgi:hypothetical protein
MKHRHERQRQKMPRNAAATPTTMKIEDDEAAN